MATVEWTGDAVRLIDQTRLPEVESWVTCATSAEVAAAIRDMVVRGAPAIGATAAFGAALALREPDPEAGLAALRASRPTARDLFAAVDRVTAAADPLAEAQRLADESVAACRAMACHALAVLPEPARVITICNTGALAVVDYGTALGAVRAAHEAGRDVSVLALETRPRAQGARLTAYELLKLGVRFRLIADSAAGIALQRGLANVALAGADRVAANGDVANKVGTYPLAVLCRRHGVPFYVVAPLSTFDLGCPDGSRIPIEERDPAEVTTFAPAGTPAWNPAFDVTPADLITGIISEAGVMRPAEVVRLARVTV